MTRPNRTSISTAPPRDTSFCLAVVPGPAGPHSGFLKQRKEIVAMNRAVIMRPGKTPPMKSLPIDCWVCIPIIIAVTLGGITHPRMPPVATELVLNITL